MLVLANTATAAEAVKERAEVPSATPVVHGTVRYEAPQWTRARGLPQNGGYVEAIDVRTGKSLWLVRVFESTTNDRTEQDKQDVFITELRLTPDAKQLIACDERTRCYRIRLNTRSVTRIKTSVSQGQKLPTQSDHGLR